MAIHTNLHDNRIGAPPYVPVAIIAAVLAVVLAFAVVDRISPALDRLTPDDPAFIPAYTD